MSQHNIKSVSVRIVVETDGGSVEEFRYAVPGEHVVVLNMKKRICSLDWSEATSDGGEGHTRLAISRSLITKDK